MPRSLCVPVLLWICVALTQPAIAQPGIVRMTPAAVRPGAATEVTLAGAKFAEPLRLWTSFPAQIEVLEQSAEQARLRITLAADIPPQVGGLFIATPDGISEPFFLAVDDLPSVAEQDKHHAFDKAQAIDIPCAVDGAANGTEADYYKFSATAGEPVTVEVLAARLGTPLDPIVELCDSQGKVLAAADDDPATGADSRLEFTPPSSGDYILRLRDVRYRGGAALRYRLRIGSFPLVATPFPLGAQAGQSATLGALAAEVEPVTVTPAYSHGAEAIALRKRGGNTSAMAQAIRSPHPQVVEVEPNDAADNATRIALPCGINGSFATDGDRDQYLFEVSGGASFRFQPRTRTLASPAYVRLSVYRPDGMRLAESPVTNADEQPLNVTFPAAGTYRLLVEELVGRGSKEHSYYIEAAPNAGVALTLKADKNAPTFASLPINGAVTLAVQAQRSGYDGPITIRAESEQGNVILLNNVIAAKQTSTQLVIAPAPGSNPGDIVSLRLVGVIERDGQQQTVPLGTADALRAKYPQLAYPPLWLEGLFALGVSKAGPESFALTPEPSELVYPRNAEQATVRLRLERKDAELKESLNVVPYDWPPGLSAEVQREGNGDNEVYVVTLKGSPTLTEGKYDLRLVCHGVAKGRSTVQIVLLPLTVVTE